MVATTLVVMALAPLHAARVVAMGAHTVVASPTHQVMVSATLVATPHPGPSVKDWPHRQEVLVPLRG
jgi:hypothetical protein